MRLTTSLLLPLLAAVLPAQGVTIYGYSGLDPNDPNLSSITATPDLSLAADIDDDAFRYLALEFTLASGETGYVFVHVDPEPVISGSGTPAGAATVQAIEEMNPPMSIDENWTGASLSGAGLPSGYTVDSGSQGTKLGIPPGRVAAFFQNEATNGAPGFTQATSCLGPNTEVNDPNGQVALGDERRSWGAAGIWRISPEPEVCDEVFDVVGLIGSAVTQVNHNAYPGVDPSLLPGLPSLASYAAQELTMRVHIQVITLTTISGGKSIKLKQPARIRRRSLKQVDGAVSLPEVAPQSWFPTVHGFTIHVADRSGVLQVPFPDSVRQLTAAWIGPSGLIISKQTESSYDSDIAVFPVPVELDGSFTSVITYIVDEQGNSANPKFPWVVGGVATRVAGSDEN